MSLELLSVITGDASGERGEEGKIASDVHALADFSRRLAETSLEPRGCGGRVGSKQAGSFIVRVPID